MREHKNSKDFDELDDIIMQGITEFTEEWIDTYPDPHEIKDEYTFSDRHNKRMERMFEHHDSFFYLITRTPKKAIASSFIALILATSVIIATNSSAQAFATDFFTNIFKEFTDIFFVVENELEEIEEYYAPSYIPEGYEVDNIDKRKLEFGIEYKNDSDEIIIFDQALPIEFGVMADTEQLKEDETLEEIKVNNEKAILIFNKLDYHLYWNNKQYRFTLIGKEKDEIIKMAESLKIFEEN